MRPPASANSTNIETGGESPRHGHGADHGSVGEDQRRRQQEHGAGTSSPRRVEHVGGRPHVDALKLHPERPCGGLRGGELRSVEDGISQHGHARQRRDHLTHQLELLATEVGQIEEHAGDVAARPGQVLDESHGHGIGLEVDGNDGDHAGGLPRGGEGARAPRHQDVDGHAHEFLRHLR
jgi:hypothetical protein